MSEGTFFSYDDEAICTAATGAAAAADELAALVCSCGSELATVTGSLRTVAALRQCAGTWTGRVGALGEDVRLVSQRLTDSLAGYRRIDEDVVAALDAIAVW